MVTEFLDSRSRSYSKHHKQAITSDDLFTSAAITRNLDAGLGSWAWGLGVLGF